MQIDINKIKVTPKNLPFNFCVYGEPSQELIDWANYWHLQLEKSGAYTNILLSDDTNIFDIFNNPTIYEYGDFFSPNLNKHLHLGHMSNLIIAKCLQSLSISKKTIAILGDTLEGSVDKSDALKKYNEYCNQFGYNIDNIFFASEQILDNVSNILTNGEGEYEGTKVFNVDDNTKIVGIKSDGSTSYFYQDVALASNLNKSTLYITGLEQNPHFDNLKKLFPETNHIGLGLVTVDKKKMSSSEGNVFFMEEIIDIVKQKFNGDLKLTWNVLAGHILKYDLPSMKDIDLKQIDNVKMSHGLYLSYTLARLKSAGMVPNKISMFISRNLQFKLLKAKTYISPNGLFEELIEHCRLINKLYIDNHIKDNIENQKMFQPLLDDLLFGMECLGLFNIDKV